MTRPRLLQPSQCSGWLLPSRQPSPKPPRRPSTSPPGWCRQPLPATRPSPQLGGQRVTNVDLLDQGGIKVGTGGGACTVVSVPTTFSRD